MADLAKISPETKEKLEELVEGFAAKMQDTIEKLGSQELVLKEQLFSLNMRVFGYLSIGNAVGIVTIFQYLLSASTVKHGRVASGNG